MNPAAWAAGGAVASALVTGLFVLLSKRGEGRSLSEATATNAQNEFMQTLVTDNAHLRERLDAVEARVREQDARIRDQDAEIAHLRWELLARPPKEGAHGIPD